VRRKDTYSSGAIRNPEAVVEGITNWCEETAMVHPAISTDSSPRLPSSIQEASSLPTASGSISVILMAGDEAREETDSNDEEETDTPDEYDEVSRESEEENSELKDELFGSIEGSDEMREFDDSPD
jgi:hypothetical protein